MIVRYMYFVNKKFHFSYFFSEKFYMDFGERLEILLKQKSITQKELAERLNIRRPSISDWKNQKKYPYADVAVKIAQILNTTVEFLVTGNPPAGLSEKSFMIARAADNLSDEGKNVVLNHAEGLVSLYPLENSVLSNSG